MGLAESRRMAVASRWKPKAELDVSGGASLEDVESGKSAVCEGKDLILSLQKHGVADG